MKSKLNPTQKLVLSAIIMALYIAILFVSQAHFLWCCSDASGYGFIWINLYLSIFGCPTQSRKCYC